MLSKEDRLRIFLRRLRRAKAAGNLDEALEQISIILNAVEDDHSGVPSNPANWMTGGRLYPPQRDSERRVEGHPSVRRFRSRQHNTFIDENGAVEIRDLENRILMAKPGHDRKGVWDP